MHSQVRDLLSAYGRLRSFNLVVDHGTGASKGFAFCEYADPLDSDRAISNLTGTQVSGLSGIFGDSQTHSLDSCCVIFDLISVLR